MQTVKKRISFVIPCYRSEKTIREVIDEIIRVVSEKKEYDYEVVCVNDCSPDQVGRVITQLAEENSKIKYIEFAKNKGKHAAILAGHAFVTGEFVVDMDDDCQSPVYELWRLLTPVENDECDVATANYYKKKESLFKRFGSWVNMQTSSIMLDKPKGMIIDNFSVMKRLISDEIIKYKNPYPYFEGLVFSITKRVNVVMMEQRERGDDNRTGYTFAKSLALWSNGLTAFSVKPLRIASMAGLIFAIAGFVWGVSIIVRKLVFHSILVMGYSSLAAIMLFSSGLMMLMLGMLGEYIGRIYISINSLPQYTIKDVKNTDLSDLQ